jgi:hypothetical protein
MVLALSLPPQNLRHVDQLLAGMPREAELGLPYLGHRVGNSLLAAHVIDLPTAFVLFQRRNDLALGELALAHRWSPYG